MNLEILTLVSLFLQLTLSCNYIDEYVNGYGYPSGSCFSLDYVAESYSYSCTATSTYTKSTYSTAGCSGTPTIDAGTSTSFNCTGYNAQNQVNNCDVVEYENWLYSKNCSSDIYVERKSYVINQCLPTGSGHSQIIKCDDSTVTFTYYDNSKCEGNGVSSHPYGESYRITKCGNKILDYCNAPGSTSTVSCNYIDDNMNGYGYPSGSCYSLDYLPHSYSFSCDSTSTYIKSTYSTAGCSGTPTIDNGTSTSFNCAGYNAQNQLNDCGVVEYENWLYSKNCSSDIYVERKSYVINQCLPTGSGRSQIVKCDDSAVTFTLFYDNLKCEGQGVSSHPYGESYRITRCGNKILDYCNAAITRAANPSSKSISLVMILSIVIGGLVLLLCLCGCYIFYVKDAKKKDTNTEEEGEGINTAEQHKEGDIIYVDGSNPTTVLTQTNI